MFSLLVFLVVGLGLPGGAAAGTPAAVEAKSDEDSDGSSDAVSDLAAIYLRNVGTGSRLLVASGVGVLAGSILAAGVDAALQGDSSVLGPYLAVAGLSVGSSLLVAGLPGVVVVPRLTLWYDNNGPAPSAVARWNLIRRWRAQMLLVQRDAGFIGGAVLAGATLIAAIGWAVNDRRGVNSSGDTYDPADLVATASLGASSLGAVLSGLVSGARLRATGLSGSTRRESRVFLKDVRVLAAVVPRPGAAPALDRPGGGTSIAVHLGLRASF
ncbi:MAG: hypothetical protein CL928_03645 [Deltaproteobacteria bacterium]|nr:hypothetical protein [Deltaproteobacteria bacterium]